MLNRIAAAKKADMDCSGDAIMDSFARQDNLPVIRPFTNMFTPSGRVNLIAEAKKASPSKGVFLEDFDPVRLAVIYETNGARADSVLLIARLLPGCLLEMVELTQELGMEPLIEVHDREELLQALDTPARVIGINNRNLQDFSVNIQLCLNLIALVPDHVYGVAESGISSPAEM